MGFFSKPETRKPAPTPVSRPNHPVTPVRTASTPPTLIGPGAHIKGELISSDDVQIEGKVEGKIRSTKQVVIGEKGQVQAEVEAQTVSIKGKLEGDCVASEKVEIAGSGQVFGNISAPRIAVAEGAVFRGASNMTPEPKPSKSPTAEHKAPQPAHKKSTETSSADRRETEESDKGKAGPPSSSTPSAAI